MINFNILNFGKFFLFVTLSLLSLSLVAGPMCEKFLKKRKTWANDDIEKLSLVAYISGAYDVFFAVESKFNYSLKEEKFPEYLDCLKDKSLKQRLSLIEKYCKETPTVPLWEANLCIFFRSSQDCIKQLG